MSDAEQLGRLAKDVVENEAYIKAVDAVKEKLTREWIKAKDINVREDAWAKIRLLEAIEWELEYFMDEGNQEQINRKFEEEKQESAEAKAKRKSDYFNTPLPGTRLPNKDSAVETTL